MADAPISATKLLMFLQRLDAEWTAAYQKTHGELTQLIVIVERHIAKQNKERQQ